MYFMGMDGTSDLSGVLGGMSESVKLLCLVDRLNIVGDLPFVVMQFRVIPLSSTYTGHQSRFFCDISYSFIGL
jgi:hypothetical protein